MREKLSSQVNSSSWLHLWNTSVFVSYLAWLLSAYLATAALEHKLKNVVQVLWLQKSFSFIFFFPFKSESNYFSFSSSLNSVAFLINPYQWDTSAVTRTLFQNAWQVKCLRTTSSLIAIARLLWFNSSITNLSFCSVCSSSSWEKCIKIPSTLS